MTWTVTSRGGYPGSAGSSPVASSSFTPAANSLLIAVIPHSGDGAVSGITGHGTWSQVISSIGPSAGDFTLWACRVGGSPSASAVTISRNYTFRFAAAIAEISHTDGINGSSVADAFGTPNVVAGYYNAAPNTLTGSLAAFAETDNLTLAMPWASTAYNDARFAPASGYTELLEFATGSTITGAVQYLAAEATAPASVVNISWENLAAAFIEVKHAAGGAQQVTGTGSAESGAATVDGTGEIVGAVEGTGALQSQSAQVAGTGQRSVVDTGTPPEIDSQSAQVAGAGQVARIGSGAVESQSAQVSGSGSVGGGVSGTGVLESQAAQADGAGTVMSVGTGALQSQAARVSGTDGAGSTLTHNSASLRHNSTSLRHKSTSLRHNDTRLRHKA